MLRSYKVSDTGEFDMFFGPKAFYNTAKIKSLFMKKYSFKIEKSSAKPGFFDLEDYSNSLYFPVVLALLKGYKVKSVEIPFKYPKIQKENEEKGSRNLFIEKRENQRLSLIIELIYFITSLRKN